jgi:hypothetical protein
MVPEPLDRPNERTPPRGWESPDGNGDAPPKSAEELLVQLINLFRQLLAVAQALLDLLEERVGGAGEPRKRGERATEFDIPIL